MEALPTSDAPLAVNARMYAINADVTTFWQRLLEWVADEADISATYLPHAPPAPLASLWERTDLACAFMCGYPFATWAGGAARPRVLAAPVPAPERYDGKPCYCTDIVVRANSDYMSLDALEDVPFGFTVEHSQSGFQAPRKMLARVATDRGRHGFTNWVGPLHTPRGVLDALFDGRIEAGPLDSYWHDLLRRHEPATAARVRTIASTPMTPIPPLVSAAGVSSSRRERLTSALTRVGSEAALADVRDALLLHAFTPVAEDVYRVLAK
jgi:ABC-type phosphate/phosphonate transport system substrate-binding protein